MPNIKSAMKRVRKSEKARCRNVETNALIKKARRALLGATDKKDKEASVKTFQEYCSILDKSVKRGILKKNTAVRRKARASSRVKAI